jgi:hypothetical protein
MLNQKNNKIRNKKNHRGKLFFSFKKSIKDTSSFIKKIYKIKIKFEKIDKMNCFNNANFKPKKIKSPT